MAKTKKSKTKDKKHSADSLRDAARSSGGGICRRLEANETATVRFLFELGDGDDGWSYLQRVYDSSDQRSYYYMASEKVSGAGKAFFAAGIDVDNDSVEVWEIRQTMMAALIDHEEEYGTITDRNYKLRRRGDGRKTEYTAQPAKQTDKPTKKAIFKARNEATGMLHEALETLLSFSE